MARGGIRFSPPLRPPPLPEKEYGGKERGEGGVAAAAAASAAAAAAAASPSGRPQEEPLVWFKKCRQSGAALPPRPSPSTPARPPACQPRTALATPGPPREATRAPRFCRRPPPAPRGPRGELPGWTAPRASGLLSSLSQPVASRQLNQNKTQKKGFKKSKQRRKIHLKIANLPKREMFEHVMSNV